ncbi:MAG: N-acetyl-gamma-glutamyl-phosphate reductase [Anaerolineae bacterium]|nr:N-acetyl-gamma-glutamyl-phosphate reductase [Anaerolineae bacterium]CAG0991786.1 LysW-gamma-L-alpha-aminoadipyl-6-phosphate/LysW-L-glutamyl-5-phosphate reductase [Anaerolineae bacterium]
MSTQPNLNSSNRVRVSIVGASGYTGGEVLRLLLGHPQVEIVQVTSESNAGKHVYSIHPNLRKLTNLQFVSSTTLQPVDVLFLALPHGEAQKRIEHFAALAPYLIDLSADFRLYHLDVYQKHYEEAHLAPTWVEKFVYGLPEINREKLRGAHYASGVGCNATASTLALLPLVKAGLIDPQRPITVDLKVGSSEGGATSSPASHHPERSGVVRTFAAVGHRHEAEVAQSLALNNVYLTVNSIELVRGVMATAQVFAAPGVDDKTLWKAYRAAYGEEPFVRIVHDKTGIHRHPEPKWLAGTNFADVGWEVQPETGRIVALCAIDNLGKGAAGSAVQCMNLMLGLPETAGLGFSGLHP